MAIHFVQVQCENRFKYIRTKYLKKKDNGGLGSIGDEFYQFEYYKEMDDLLGKKPNIVPKYLASYDLSPKNKNNRSQTPHRSSSTTGSRTQSVLSSENNQNIWDDGNLNVFFSNGGWVSDPEDEILRETRKI